jgi:5-methyltetrahydrofolate--homocysteine methyltransferase
VDLLELVDLRPVLGDGGMGTMLQMHGLTSGECPEAWNFEKPEAVTATHKAYADAGCDFLTTNTFGANPIKLSRHGMDSKIDEIIARGVELARGAAAGGPMVAGSVGPTGGLLEPYGELPAAEVAEAFKVSAGLLERAGIDFFIVETMTDLNEALLAVRAIRGLSEKPIVATMAFTRGAKGVRTVMGTSPEQAAAGLEEAGANVIGTNCCSGMEEAADIMKEILAATALPTIAQPNAGLPVPRGDKVVYPETPEAMAAGLETLLGLGVRIVGGCCGTTPDHLAVMGLLLGRAEHPPGVN